MIERLNLGYLSGTRASTGTYGIFDNLIDYQYETKHITTAISIPLSYTLEWRNKHVIVYLDFQYHIM